ncbi:MAG: FkbM family methyltransferase [Deltaproteobacteria bacterium]|nr:FkbM family methyltransferase [Deltaproteobacteria bacterium]
MMTTRTKIALARIVHRVIARGRRLAGRGSSTVAARGGIRYHLDLDEGIDFSLYLLGAFEPRTRRALRRLVRRGDVVFDIGANIGAHTLDLARAVGSAGHVYAFEPADLAFAKLQRNLALNPPLAARTSASRMFLAAVSSGARAPDTYASWPLVACTAVHPTLRGQLASTAGAAIASLDDFVSRQRVARLDLIKIDVDGHELPVLQGAAATLRRFRPTLVMELAPYLHAEARHRFADFIALLRRADYSLRPLGGGRPLPLDAARLARAIPDGASRNVIARAGGG